MMKLFIISENMRNTSQVVMIKFALNANTTNNYFFPNPLPTSCMIYYAKVID